jgi:predicted Zn-dependent protease with MMP-like domain
MQDALDDLPEEFRNTMNNVEVLVEDFPNQETLDNLNIQSPYELLGLYEGAPINQQSVFYVSPYPHRIVLFRIPILGAVESREEISQKIREVIIHEVGHHLGFDDSELEEMEGRGR